MCFIALIWGYFFLPELKNRSLEELEELFAAKIPIRKFGQYETSPDGVGAAVSRLERLDSNDPTITKLHMSLDETEKVRMEKNGAA